MGLQSLVLLLCAVRGAEPKNASLALARSVPLPQRLAAGRRRLSDQYAQIAKLAASDGAVVDRFGYSVAIDGDTVVVGAIDNDDGGPESGAAYVFRTTDGWDTQIELKLMAADAAANDNFGYSVAINGNTVVVGAVQSDNGGTGAAYVFRTSDGGATYNEVAKLTASDAASNDRFGFSLAIDGDTVVVGTYRNCVYVFRTSDGGATYGQVAMEMSWTSTPRSGGTRPARPRARERPTRAATRRSGSLRRAATCSRYTHARTGPPWTPSTWHHPAPRTPAVWYWRPASPRSAPTRRSRPSGQRRSRLRRRATASAYPQRRRKRLPRPRNHQYTAARAFAACRIDRIDLFFCSIPLIANC